MAYHLQLTAEEWWRDQTLTQQWEDVDQLALSTDGILSFDEPTSTIDPLFYLLMDRQYDETPQLLQKRCRYLERDYQLRPKDDLGLVRLWQSS